VLDDGNKGCEVIDKVRRHRHFENLE